MLPRLLLLLLGTLALAGCATPVVSHPVSQAPAPIFDAESAQRVLVHTLLRARVPRLSPADIKVTEHAVFWGQRPPTAGPLYPPIILGGGFGAGYAAGAYARQVRQAMGSPGTAVFFDAIGAVEVYRNGYVFVKNTGGVIITKVLFLPGDDARLFAEALRVLASGAL